METIDKTTVNGFVKTHRIAILNNRQTTEKILASLTETRPVGMGRDIVRVMILSKSRSIIWLMQTEAPESKKAPTANIESTNQSMLPFDANPYPKAHENATSIDKRGFSNS